VAAAVVALTGGGAVAETLVYRGVCDASAVVLLDERHFVVASDEDNLLRVYRLASPEPVASVDLHAHLGIDGTDEHAEVDIEGAARLGEHVFWIGSHGRSRAGRYRPHRHNLFATRFDASGESWSGAPVGEAYQGLARDLSEHPKLAGLGLAKAIRRDRSDRVDELAPKQAGLSIEGLAVGPDRSLLIGLRNPLASDRRAILVRLENPEGVVLGGEPPRYGDPIPIDLHGLGIRSIEYVASEPAGYTLIAGPKARGATVLYRWSGSPSRRPERLQTLVDLKAEGLAAAADGERLLIVSDDGSRLVGARVCKELTDPLRRTFRTRWISREGGETRGPQGGTSGSADAARR
jgi:hypothetical protein